MKNCDLKLSIWETLCHLSQLVRVEDTYIFTSLQSANSVIPPRMLLRIYNCCDMFWITFLEGKGREGKGREGKGRKGKERMGWEGEWRGGKGKENKGR